MCVNPFASSAPSITAPNVAPAPTRASVAATADPTSLAATARKILPKRLGVFGNLSTTPMGDASYGSSSFAKFGGAAA